MKIPFNKPPYTGHEDQFVLDSMRSAHLAGDGRYSKFCHQWFSEDLGSELALLTPSCTHALEMAAILIGIGPGDEVIMPSYTFVSTANAFVLRGATVVFVDVRPDTMNLDEKLLESAITNRTKAVVVVHYAGISCEMTQILEIASRNNLVVVEDAAQGIMSTYRDRKLGGIGQIGAYSFHETKNLTSAGEGGLLIVNDEKYKDRAEIIREKGTNRGQFFRGMVDKYSWVDIGSSYLPSDVQAAYLWGQLQHAESIIENRMQTWHQYHAAFEGLEKEGRLIRPVVPRHCKHNAHLYYIKTTGLEERTQLIQHLKKFDISAAFHYVPLHSATAGEKYSRFSGVDVNTTIESEKLLRLPLWYGMSTIEREYVIDKVNEFFNQ